ncbi:MAG: molybdate ABC transporter substrate-binding protein [Vicinamibacterales bacterium]
MPRHFLRLALVAGLALGFAGSARAQDRGLLVSAASSLSDVMRDLAAAYTAETGVVVRVTTAGSNTLARQIAAGAPVDVFVSADEVQMDVVERAGRVVAGTRVPLLHNTLVVIVPADGPAVATAGDLAGPAVRRLAMGNPDSVPAGVYGRTWLESRGVWDRVRPKVVPLPTVRAALAAVREGRAQAGIVYATDARTTDAVRVTLRVPAAEAPPVVYPAAAIAGDREGAARAFLAWLGRPVARARFEAAGFEMADGR